MTQSSPSQPSFLTVFLSWLTTFTVPVALALTAVRIVLNPWFVEFEYRTPFFPADPYGFTFEQRLQYAHIAVQYLVNDAGIEFLEVLKLPDNQQAPVNSCQFRQQDGVNCYRFYDNRELQHMLDVKNTVTGARWVWVVAYALLLVINIIAYKGNWEPRFRHALALGGWLTLGLISVILLAVFTIFDWLFVLFHRIFFQGDSWLFLTSDSLIRLFPERFWSDTFIMVGVLTVIMALLVGLGVDRAKKPS